MNEQIEQLVKQFAEDLMKRSGYDMREYEPFLAGGRLLAERIITKCAVVASRCEANGTKNVGAEILEHFGVE